jgi:hypothetical protein
MKGPPGGGRCWISIRLIATLASQRVFDRLDLHLHYATAARPQFAATSLTGLVAPAAALAGPWSRKPLSNKLFANIDTVNGHDGKGAAIFVGHSAAIPTPNPNLSRCQQHLDTALGHLAKTGFPSNDRDKASELTPAQIALKKG